MLRTIFNVIVLYLVGTSAVAASALAPFASPASTSSSSGDLPDLSASDQEENQQFGFNLLAPGSMSPLLRLAEAPRDLRVSRPTPATQPHRVQDPRRMTTRREPGSGRAVPATQPSVPLPRPTPALLRNTELALATSDQSVSTAETPPVPPEVIPPQAAPAGSTVPEQPPGKIDMPATDPLPRGRNEPPAAGAPTSYSDRVAGYWNNAVDYVNDGLGSISGYLPDWKFGWSNSEGPVVEPPRERLLVEAMKAAGYELATVARDGAIVTTVTYTFHQLRRPSASDRLLATKLATDLAAASGGVGGYFEQSMIKSALEGSDNAELDIKTFELQTRPYPWLRSVAGPRSTPR